MLYSDIRNTHQNLKRIVEKNVRVPIQIDYDIKICMKSKQEMTINKQISVFFLIFQAPFETYR